MKASVGLDDKEKEAVSKQRGGTEQKQEEGHLGALLLHPSNASQDKGSGCCYWTSWHLTCFLQEHLMQPCWEATEGNEDILVLVMFFGKYPQSFEAGECLSLFRPTRL